MRKKLIKGIDINLLGKAIGKLMTSGWRLINVTKKTGDPFISVALEKEKLVRNK